MNKTQHALELAEQAARGVVDLLQPACERIEIAGSIRRRRPLVGNIEIVAVGALARRVVDLFGREQTVDLLGASLQVIGGNPPAVAGVRGTFALARPIRLPGERAAAWGPRYKRLCLIWDGYEFAVDLFQVDAENWGNQLALRTGPAEFSKLLVTPRRHGGACPHGVVHARGRVYRSGRPLALRRESDYFSALGLPFVPPQERTAGRLRELLSPN